MPRKYLKRLGSRPYQNYDKANLKKAVQERLERGTSYRALEEKYGIARNTINTHVRNRNEKKPGGQLAVSLLEEQKLVQSLMCVADWGFPLEPMDVRILVKQYYDKLGVTIKKFKNNLPGPDWVKSFLLRHKNNLAVRLSENIKRARAAVDRDAINRYFTELAVSLQDVPDSHIVNYDETNFTDDPGRQRVVIRRTSKHADRVLDSSKSATSVMFAISGSGVMLPPFIVFKSEHLYQNWVKDGPPGTRYGNTKSGWFDSNQFEEWFLTIALKYFRRLEGPKVLIGDNLASHISQNVILECQKNGIRFILLPPNSTHLTQPLDTSFFKPIKQSWRKTLGEWKKKNRGVIPKPEFPGLLKKTLDSIKDKLEDNIKSGFRGCGIIPLDSTQVLKRLPPEVVPEEECQRVWTEALTEFLKTQRGSQNTTRKTGKGKKLAVTPGKSVICEESETSSDTDNDLEESESFISSDKSSMHEQNSEDEEKHEDENDELEEARDLQARDLRVDDFVIAKFTQGKFSRNFVGQIIDIQNKEININFLRQTSKIKNGFIFPAVRDESVVNISQILKKLPQPVHLRRGAKKFPIDINLKN